MTIKLKSEIESICWKVGVNPKEVERIVISPMDVELTMREYPLEGLARQRQIITVPYAYEDDRGDQEEDREASDRAGSAG